MYRLLLLILALAVTSGCSGPATPSQSLAGTWSEHFSFPGASLVLRLDASGNGDGTYAIEAGRSGTVQVAGSVAASVVTLSIRYDYGPVRTFTGTFTDANRLTGTFDDAQPTVVFTRS